MDQFEQTDLERAMDVLEFEESESREEAEAAGEGEAETETETETEEEAPESESLLSEVDEMEFAAEMLGVNNEAELDRFIGNFVKKAARAVGRAIPASALQTAGGILKGAIRKALPKLGSLAGGYIAGPSGAAWGGRLAANAGSLFGLELEGLSPEDKEFEVARRLIRFGGATVRRLGKGPRGLSTRQAARGAAVQAAQYHAPGLTLLPDSGPVGSSVMRR